MPVHNQAIRIWRCTLDFRFTFSHHLASRNATETVLVEVRYGEPGIQSGFGQALPRAYLTGESIDGVIEEVQNMWRRWLEREPPETSATADVLSALRPIYQFADGNRRTAAYAAFEMAVLDAWGKSSGHAVTAGPAGSHALPLVGVISAGSPGKAAAMARLLSLFRYRRFKVKVGIDPSADLKLVAAVRKAVGNGAWLAADANQAFDPDEAVICMRQLAKYGVELMEEPLRAEYVDGTDYQALERAGGMAVMADETLCTRADAGRLLRQGRPSWWNIRYAKNGGLSGCLELARLAKDNGVTVYGGILVGETSALAAAGQAAFFSTGAVCAEYGFPRVFLRSDPFRGGPGGFFGKLLPFPTDRPGFGYTLRPAGMPPSAALVWTDGPW